MLLLAAGTLTGICLFYLSPAAPPPALCLGLPVILVAGARCRPRWRWLPAIAFGFLWAVADHHLRVDGPLPAALAGRDVTLVGRVVSLPQLRANGVRFRFDVESLHAAGGRQPSPGRIRLRWREPELAPRLGERWALRARLRPPRGFLNPGGFDYEAWLYREGIAATGYVRSVGENRRLQPPRGVWRVAAWRQQLRDRIAAVVPEPASAGLLQALVVGDRSGLQPADWEAFRRTGTSHLVAISGLHIGLVAGLLLVIGRWLWRAVPRWQARFPASHAGIWLALLGATGYAALAGFAIPTRRALLMLLILLGAGLARRQGQPARALALALLIVLLLQPAAVLSAGFWLSFAAVGVLFYTLLGRSAPARRGLVPLRVQWSLLIGLLPVLAAATGEFSLAALFVNLLAVPWFGFLVVPLALLGSMLLVVWETGESFVLWPAATLADWGRLGIGWVARFDLVAWNLPPASPLALAVAIAGALLLLAPRGLPGRHLGLLLLAPLFLRAPDLPPPGGMRLTMLDVGQGLAAVVETHRHVLVFDLGPRFSPRFDATRAAVIQYLRRRGWRRVDRVIVSHSDIDHAGNLPALRAALPVRELLSGEPTRLNALGARLCVRGERWSWDGVRFSILSPSARSDARDNDASCVLRVEHAAGRVLLTGDIGRRVESQLLTRDSRALRAEIVAVPHHGSGSSSSPGFVRAVDATYALVSAGFANRWGFPKPEVVARWERSGARVLNTATTGAVSFEFAPDGTLSAPHLYRLQRERPWRR